MLSAPARNLSEMLLPVEAGKPPPLIVTDCEHKSSMASTVADNVSRPAAPLSFNPSKNPLRLRARAAMIASAYTYPPTTGPPQTTTTYPRKGRPRRRSCGRSAVPCSGGAERERPAAVLDLSLSPASAAPGTSPAPARRTRRASPPHLQSGLAPASAAPRPQLRAPRRRRAMAKG